MFSVCFSGANILRDVSGNIKLSDFGTSRRLIAITNQNQPDSGTIGKI
jgi:serine/threonine protein kinase